MKKYSGFEIEERRRYKTKIIDKNRWEVLSVDDDTWFIMHDKKNDYYYDLGYICGYEQISHDEFLIYNGYPKCKITRYKFKQSEAKVLFSKYFWKLDTISDNLIMLTSCYDYEESKKLKGEKNIYDFICIYSIKDNIILKEAEWLNGNAIEFIKDDKDPNNNLLYVEDIIKSDELHNPKLIYSVDPNTFKPNSYCYSELRNSFIKINDQKDIETIKVEDKNYCKFISDFLLSQKCDNLEKAKEKILSKKIEPKWSRYN